MFEKKLHHELLLDLKNMDITYTNKGNNFYILHKYCIYLCELVRRRILTIIMNIGQKNRAYIINDTSLI